jgi:hypothetical protein
MTGCLDPLTDSSLPLDVQAALGWQPDIQVQAIARPTLLLTITRPLADQEPLIQVLSSYDPSPVITITRAADAGLPGELSVSQPAMTISYQYPITESLPYRMLVLEPGMVVTVTQEQLSGELFAQIIPAYDPPESLQVSVRSPSAQLEPVPGRPGVYSQMIPLQYPFFNGFTRIWADSASAPSSGSVKQAGLQEAISEFFLSPAWPVDLRGGGGADMRGGGGVDLRGGGGADWRGGGGVDLRGGGGVDLRGGGGADMRGGGGVDMRGGGGADMRGGGGADMRGGGGASIRAWGANQRALGAPVASADGQVTIFNNRDLFGETSTTSLEALVRIKGLPDWLTPVGQAYRFISGREIERAIAFNYLQRDVPDGYEYTLKIYYSPDGLPGSWVRLDTALDRDENLAIAPVQTSGLYMLAATVDLELPGTGWQLFSYPMPDARPVGEALQSISGRYATVYSFDGQSDDPWKVFYPEAEPWVSNLSELEFGRGYWINVDQPVTIHFSIPITPTLFTPPEATFVASTLTPPAIVYGSLPGSLVSASTTRLTISAYVYGQKCGETLALRGPDGFNYRIAVAATSEAQPSCGTPGRSIVLRIGQTVVDTLRWNNNHPISP